MKFLSLILPVILIANVKANDNPLDWSFKAEGGYYRASGSSLLKQSDLISQFQGAVRYKQNENNSNWLFELKARPEFYGLDNDITILKMSGRGQYQHRFSKFHLSVALFSQKNFYLNNNIDLNFSIFKISSSLLWLYKRRTFFQFSANYFYRDLNNGFSSSLDAVSLIGKIYKSISPHGKIGIGVYAERFKIQSDISTFFRFGADQNSGWRFGPEVSFNYSRHFVININSHFLFHESDLAEDPDNEQWIQVLLGKLLSSRWSIFLLADYYLRHFPDQPDFDNQLIYLPIDNENNFYLKLEYGISKEIDLFFNLGFSKENLVYQNLNLSGFRGTVGIKIDK
jgi:hypothetical protein